MKRTDNIKKWIAVALTLVLLLALIPCSTAEGTETPEELDVPSGETPAAAEETEAEAENPDDWETRLLLMLQERSANPETIGAGYYNFVTGETHFYNGDQYRVSGSMYKVPLNMLFLNWVDEGKITMDESISGYRYSQLLEGTIIDSNNDYAKILWDYAGATIQTDPASTLYHRYRILIAPLMGEDPDNVDDKYYENNFFTPRQVITCLQHLYEGGEKYDSLIDAMQRAEPEKYFKLHERRFNMAHKYGWYAEDPILYLNDCAICFTDDPIAIVLFTSGTDNAYGVMADFSTLMCNYAQEKHTERIAREEEEAARAAEAAEEALLAAEAAAAESPALPRPFSVFTDATDSNPVSVQKQEERIPSLQRETGPIVALGGIVLFVLGALIWFALRHRSSRMNLLCALLTVLFTAAAMMLCFTGLSGQSYISVPDENPQNVVVRFFNALRNGEYETAEACLGPGAQLGLVEPDHGSAHSAALEALRASWDYRMIGECAVDKSRAWQELQLQVLVFSKMESDLQRETRSQLLMIAREQSREALYDEGGNYRPEVASEAYDRAMDGLLAQPQSYYASVGLRMELTLTKEGWRIVPTKELFSALCGKL